MKIFVTGATGLVGRHLIARLLERGDQVVGLTRNAASAASILPEAVELIEGNAVVPGEWQQAIASCDAVVNLAGDSVGDGYWTKKKKKRIRRSRLSTTFNLVQGLEERETPAVLVSASATGYYGDGKDRALGEDSQSGHGFLARLACEWEHTAQQAESEHVRVVLVRIGVVLAAEGGALPKMMLPYKFGLGGPLGSGNQYFPWIHIDDLVRVFMFCLDQEQLSGALNASVPTPPRQKEFAQALGRRLGKPSFMAAPAFALKMLLGEKAAILLASQRVVPNVLKAGGFKFEYGEVEDALADLVPSP
nr:TIGR01777 family oxidoreductase [Candidatus Krumholzibacteria bacterium]